MGQLLGEPEIDRNRVPHLEKNYTRRAHISRKIEPKHNKIMAKLHRRVPPWQDIQIPPQRGDPILRPGHQRKSRAQILPKDPFQHLLHRLQHQPFQPPKALFPQHHRGQSPSLLWGPPNAPPNAPIIFQFWAMPRDRLNNRSYPETPIAPGRHLP